MSEDLQLLKVSVFLLSGEFSLNSHFTHTTAMQALHLPDHRARVVFCQWLLAKYVVGLQFLANNLFTYEVQFRREGILNFHNTHVWYG